MANYVTYFALFIFMLFGIAFYAALQGFKKLDEDQTTSNGKPHHNRLEKGAKETVDGNAEINPSRTDSR